MSLVRRVMNRLRGPQPANFPPSMIDGVDWFWTGMYSLDKEPPPTDRLLDLTLRSVQEARSISLDDLAARPDFPYWFSTWPGEHYRLLAGVMRVLAPKVTIEIGTDTGMSTLVLKRFAPPGGKVVTFDLVPWKQVEDHALRDEDFADGVLEQRLADLGDPATFEANRALLEACEFFFIDGPKDAVFEFRLMENFKKLNFAKKPILLFDDMRLQSMIKFWYQLKLPKLDITSFGHWSGSGLAEWI